MLFGIFKGIHRRVDHLNLAAKTSGICKTLCTSRHTNQIAKGTNRYIFLQSKPYCLINKICRCHTDRTTRTRNQFHLRRQNLSHTKMKNLMGMCSTHFHHTDSRTIIAFNNCFFNCSFIVTPPEDLLPHPHLLL